MGRRKDKIDNTLPQLTIARPGRPTLEGGQWRVEKSQKENLIWCDLRLAGFKPPEQSWKKEAMPFGGENACWRLEISRTKSYRGDKRMPDSGFSVELSYCGNGSGTDATIGSRVIFRGRQRRWEDAIRDVKYHAPIHDQIAWTGKVNLYGPEAAANWITMRPFVVTYPWRDPKEPNAKYSPFTLAGDFQYDPENDGAAMSCWSKPAVNGRSLDLRETIAMCHHLDANAFLLQREDGSWVVHHRDGMYAADPIDIDDWRARVIAGLAYEF